MQQKAERGDILRMTAEVVAAYVGNNSLPAKQLSDVINTVFGTLNRVNSKNGAAVNGHAQKAAVSVRRSVTPDYIICLEDGKKLKMLKRHLRTVYGLTPDEYRAKWRLPTNYPMVAPNYSKQRSAFAKKIGFVDAVYSITTDKFSKDAGACRHFLLHQYASESSSELRFPDPPFLHRDAFEVVAAAGRVADNRHSRRCVRRRQ